MICQPAGYEQDYIGIGKVKATPEATAEGIIGRFNPDGSLKNKLASSTEFTVGETTMLADADIGSLDTIMHCSEMGEGKYIVIIFETSGSSTRYVKLYEWADKDKKTLFMNPDATLTYKTDLSSYVDSFTKLNEDTIFAQ